MSVVKFKCPACDSNRLEEVMTGVTVTREITSVGIDREVADLTYGNQINEDGELDCYQCAACGTALRLDNDQLVTGPAELATWFEQHPTGSTRDYRGFSQYVRRRAVELCGDYPDIESANHWEAFYAITRVLEGAESANRSWHKLTTCLREAFKMTPEEFVEAFAETDQIDPETLTSLRTQLGIKEDASPADTEEETQNTPVYLVTETVTYEVPGNTKEEAVDTLINGGDPNRFMTGVIDRYAERIDPDDDYDEENDPPYPGDEA